ncbi:MAG: hypothetical protein OXF55_11265 [Caldilineaceae bacterium]|nr:hypothetical protein [Caldilineaceae bacterium]MDE0069938.1 hypothetical protein [Caldilineaceae bacterium]
MQTPWKSLQQDAATHGAWCAELDGADAVIKLAGRSVNCRYNPGNRRQIMQSCVVTSRLVGEAVAAARRPPRVWPQASTATIYAHRFDEAGGIIGGGEADLPDSWRFSLDVAQAWERELDNASVAGTPKVKVRSAMVMSPQRGGVFDALLSLVRVGLGGKAGNGRQYISWIHYAGFVQAVCWLIDQDEIDDVINIASPNPLPNAEFIRHQRAAWGIPFGLPATGWMLEVGAFVMRSETELILKSRRVVHGILAERGFRFQFP